MLWLFSTHLINGKIKFFYITYYLLLFCNQDSFSEIFGASRTETAQLSKQVSENIPQGSVASGSHMKLSHSVSSLSISSSTSSNIRPSQPTKQCEITNKLLSFTLNVIITILKLVMFNFILIHLLIFIIFRLNQCSLPMM